MEKTSHVVIVPSPGISHLIPIIEFGKHLVKLHDFHVICIIPTTESPSNAMKATLEALPSTINHIFLPPVSFDDLPESTSTTTLVALAITRSLPSLRDELRSLITATRLVALVVDHFGTDVFDVAKEFDLSTYIFFPLSAMTLSFAFYIQKLDKMVSCEYRDLREPIKIPGCMPVHGKDLVDAVEDRTSEVYRWFLDITERYSSAKGIFVNTFMDMEAGALKAWVENDEEPSKPPIYPIGPLTRAASIDPDDGSMSNCLRWLDNQPTGSVLFVSFGSGGTLSRAQLYELASGLEMSEQRFLWVLRSPDEESASATYLSVQSKQDPFDFLPEGFCERTKGRGLVISSWAPQVQVLCHGSTGGFLTHCGWNSILESVVSGVPLIAWPLYAEQKLNAVMLSEDINVALRPKQNESGLVIREEIARIVKELMEGEEGNKIDRRMKELKDAAAKALKEDGTSIQALGKLVLQWKNQMESNSNISR